ncbi:unnamed protein product [Rhizoctonia solani]|uniref:BTB domain-containing protein n=1 Tax=Rhizoctonia solani TaxID=456999 RepID=A0A8H3GRU8_9AGAM|nr:unnamed protein product [Rhizoctonia solani]
MAKNNSNTYTKVDVDVTTPTEKPVATKRHSKINFDNTLVVIQVEDTLFNVHKYQLLKSETFSDMFKIPSQSNDQPEEGSSPEHPIVMQGVSATDFEALLTVLYARTSIGFPSYFSNSQPTPEASLIIPAFRLANMWNFSDLRAYLIPFTETVLGDIDKIVFAREFGIQDWLALAHKNLCERTEPITLEEARKLGIESLVFISRMRELFRPPLLADSPSVYYCESCAGVKYSKSDCICTACNESTYPRYCRIETRSPSTSTALVTKLDEWISNGCVWKD